MARFKTPETGLKMILLGDSRGLMSSRSIERACRENVWFMAMSGDLAPRFTTIVAFVHGLGDELTRLFAGVLTVCDRQGQIGRELFAIDGVKQPFNASKSRSGTRADFAHQAQKMETQVKQLINRHRAEDEAIDAPSDSGQRAREPRSIERMAREAAQCRDWLARNPEDRPGAKASIPGAETIQNQIL